MPRPSAPFSGGHGAATRPALVKAHTVREGPRDPCETVITGRALAAYHEKKGPHGALFFVAVRAGAMCSNGDGSCRSPGAVPLCDRPLRLPCATELSARCCSCGGR